MRACAEYLGEGYPLNFDGIKALNKLLLKFKQGDGYQFFVFHVVGQSRLFKVLLQSKAKHTIVVNSNDLNELDQLSDVVKGKVREKFHRVPDGGSYCLADHDCQSISQGGGASLPLASVHAVLVLLSARTLLAHAQIIVMIAGKETTGLQIVLMTMAGFTFSVQDLYEKILPRSSCFPLTIEDDRIEGIYNTSTQCALIFKSAGGIGVAISNVSTKGGYIRGPSGNRNDVVPMPL